MNFKEAQLFLQIENYLCKKKYKEIAKEIGISKSDVGNIIAGNFKMVNKKVLDLMDAWIEEKWNTLTFWQKFLKFVGVRK